MYIAMCLMNFISAVFSLLVVTFFSAHISQPCKSDGLAKISYILSIEIVFGINLVPKHCSEFPVFVK
jgi:hypothetical protein